jgi:catechol 2,3-dioxygenase-like lactoylglutathione lyase family enzyme
MSKIDRVAVVTVAVKDQDEALRWFTDKLGFVKRQDMRGPGIRWLTVAPEAETDLELVLASWFPEHVGKNAPLVVHTTDCRGTFRTLNDRGVEFTQPPSERPYGLEAVFKDLYGNAYALVEPPAATS